MTRALQISSGNFYSSVVPSLSSSLLETDALSRQFAEGLSDFGSISYMMAAGGIGRLASGLVSHTLGRNLSFFASMLSETVGVGTEAAAFTLFTNPTASAFEHHFTNFSILRMAAFLGRGSNTVLQHGFESLGMVLGDEVSGTNREKPLTQRLLEASVFGIQNRVSMAAAHVFVPIAFHRFALPNFIPHESFVNRIETLFHRRNLSGLRATSIGLSTFLYGSLATANPLKSFAQHFHDNARTIPLAIAGLGIAIYLGRKIVARSLWRPHPERTVAKALIERNSADLEAFFNRHWKSFNSVFQVSNSSPSKAATLTFRGSRSRLGTRKCTLLGLLTIEGHSLPIAVKRSPEDVRIYKSLLKTHPQVSTFFPQLYGIVGDFIISKRLEGLESRSIEKIAEKKSTSREAYIFQAWSLIRRVLQERLYFDDVDFEIGSNLIYDPKSSTIHLVELGSLRAHSEVPRNFLNFFLRSTQYGLWLGWNRRLSDFDCAFIEEALKRQGVKEAPFALICYGDPYDPKTIKMDPTSMQIYEAFLSGRIPKPDRIVVTINYYNNTIQQVALEDLIQENNEFFRLSSS